MWKKPGFFDHQKYIENSTEKQCGLFDHYVEKSTWKQHGHFNEANYIEKVRGNDVEIL